jgi:hypothetical protein
MTRLFSWGGIGLVIGGDMGGGGGGTWKGLVGSEPDMCRWPPGCMATMRRRAGEGPLHYTGERLDALSRGRTWRKAIYNRAQRGDGTGVALGELDGESQTLLS